MCIFFRHYLKEEHKAKKDRELDETKWTVGILKSTVNKYTDTVTKVFFFTDRLNAVSSCLLGDSSAEKWQ